MNGKVTDEYGASANEYVHYRSNSGAPSEGRGWEGVRIGIYTLMREGIRSRIHIFQGKFY